MGCTLKGPTVWGWPPVALCWNMGKSYLVHSFKLFRLTFQFPWVTATLYDPGEPLQALVWWIKQQVGLRGLACPTSFSLGLLRGCSILSWEMVTGVWGQDLKGKADCGPAGSSGRHTGHWGRTSGGTKSRTSIASIFSRGSWPLEGVVVVYLDYTCTFKNQELILVIFGGLLQII